MAGLVTEQKMSHLVELSFVSGLHFRGKEREQPLLHFSTGVFLFVLVNSQSSFLMEQSSS